MCVWIMVNWVILLWRSSLSKHAKFSVTCVQAESMLNINLIIIEEKRVMLIKVTWRSDLIYLRCEMHHLQQNDIQQIITPQSERRRTKSSGIIGLKRFSICPYFVFRLTFNTWEKFYIWNIQPHEHTMWLFQLPFSEMKVQGHYLRSRFKHVCFSIVYFNVFASEYDIWYYD